MHSFRFYRAGGVEQVRLDTGADLANLAHLDPKLWVALSCPVKGLELDEHTLAMIDTDGDGRVRVGELLSAVAFCKDSLKSLDSLLVGGSALPLDTVDPQKPLGAAILASAREILRGLGKGESSSIALEDVADRNAVLAKALFNGDGVVVAAALPEGEARAVHAELLATVGGVKDAGGAEGVAKEHLEAFFAEARAYADWYGRAEAHATELLPAGPRTAAAYAAVQALAAKVDDFFVRCRVAAFDGRSAVALQGEEEALAAVVAGGLSANASELAGFPLARASAGAALPLDGPVNPAWAAALLALRRDAVLPLLGARDAITEAEWRELLARLEAFARYSASKPVTRVEKLGIDRLRAILAGPAQAALEAALAEDRKYQAQFDDIGKVERLIRLQRDLYRLINNFVSFADFYDPAYPASFQVGTLYLDSRTCELCVGVDDPAKHAAMAGQSMCFLAYCDLTRKGGTERRQIVAVVTNGDAESLTVGRNGIFYDRRSGDWDATITRVVDNPISIRQAFWTPYRKFLRMVEELISRRAAAADEAAQAKVAAAANATASVGSGPARAPAAVGTAPPLPGGMPKKLDPASIALISVSVSGLASVLGVVLTLFFGLGKWMPVALLGLVFVISGPSMFLAWLKLRQRNIGPILEANGWAINSRAKVNAVFGATLTQLPRFPPGSRRSFRDPFSIESGPLPWIGRALIPLAIIAAVIAGAYHVGMLTESSEERLRFLGVPHHLKVERELAASLRDEAIEAQRKVQQDVVEPAQKTYDALKEKADADPGDLQEARLDLDEARSMLRDAHEETAAARERYVRARDRLNAARGVLQAPPEAPLVAGEPPAAPAPTGAGP